MSGYCAELQPDGATWMVSGGLLADSVRKLLEVGNQSLGPLQQQFMEQQAIGSQPLHYETKPPRTTVGRCRPGPSAPPCAS